MPPATAVDPTAVEQAEATPTESLVHASAHTEEMRAKLTAYLAPLSESGTLKDAYLLQSASIEPTDQHLEGLVVTVAADAPASVFTTTRQLGAGVTWVRVQRADGASSDIDEARVIANFKTLGPEFSDTRVALVSGLDFPDKAYYVVAEGNDRDAADQLHERARAMSVEDVVSGALQKDYQALVRSSFGRRAAAIESFMALHALDLDKSMPTGNHLTHYIEHAHALSTPSQSSRQQALNTFVAYVGATDPSQAHSGLMVYRGPIAGYSHMRLREPKTVKGQPSMAWENADSKGKRPFSMFPASTGLFVAKSQRAADRHKNQSDRVRRAHAERVRWSGDVATYNPRAEAVYHATNDAHWIKASSSLGVAPGGPVVATDFDTVVIEVPGISTRTMRLAQLADVLARSDETRLTVETRSALAWLHSYDAADQLNLADIFSSQTGATMALSREHIALMNDAGVQ